MVRGLLASALGTALLFAPASARADDETVKVHMTGDSGLVLERRIEETSLWESVCVGTCDRPIQLEGSYRLNGRGLRPSLPIALLRARVLRLEALPAYDAAYVGGITLEIIGPMMLVGGVIATAVGTAQRPAPPCPFDAPCPTQEPQSDAMLVGGVMTILTSAVLIGVGMVAILLGDHTRTRQLQALSARGLSITF